MIVLMNVLHEIGIQEWESLFLAIKKVLKTDGYLVFAEAKTLSLGEQPDCENGYLVLEEEQLKRLFAKENRTSGIMSVSGDAEKNGKSEFVIVPACELEYISEKNIKSALENLQLRTLTRLKGMDAERIQSVRKGTRPSFTYRKYAFAAQQYVNATLALDFWVKPKFKTQIVKEAEADNINTVNRVPKNRHTVNRIVI